MIDTISISKIIEHITKHQTKTINKRLVNIVEEQRLQYSFKTGFNEPNYEETKRTAG